MSGGSSRVLIVDDHPIVRFGLRFLIEQNDRFTVCGEAGDVDAARELGLALAPDFIVLDLVLGGRDGVEFVRSLAGLVPASRILVYSSQSEWRFARRVLQAGAHGYVAKAEGLPVVGEALDVLATGEPFLSATLQRRLLEDFIGTGEAAGDIDQLSGRELQVLQMIGDGVSTGRIGAALGLSAKTIGTYRERIKTKLGAASARALSERAREHVETL